MTEYTEVTQFNIWKAKRKDGLIDLSITAKASSAQTALTACQDYIDRHEPLIVRNDNEPDKVEPKIKSKPTKRDGDKYIATVSYTYKQ